MPEIRQIETPAATRVTLVRHRRLARIPQRPENVRHRTARRTAERLFL